MSSAASPTLPDDLTDDEDFTMTCEKQTSLAPEPGSLPSTLEDDLAAQLFGDEDDDFGAGLFSDEERLDDEMGKPETPAPPIFQELEGGEPEVASSVPQPPPEPTVDSSAAADIPPPPKPVSTGGREADYASRGDKMSRFTKDAEGNLIHKWKIDYAQRGGGGRAQCRDLDCLERHEQGGLRTIEKGGLRIARRVLMPAREGEEPKMVLMWHHARCIFNTFLRAKKSTRLIESEDDIEDFNLISLDDQALLRRIIAGNENLQKARFAEGQDATTPVKRTLDGSEFTPAKRRKGTEPPELKVGNRVWTHCRVRASAPAGGGPLAGDVPVKSPKPELAMIVDEPKDGRVIVQFESAEMEKERLEKHGQKKFKPIRGWLRYPRIFEGKKQRVPIDWIKSDRPPPKMCGCCKQHWGHCSRSSKVSVWGVAVQ